jgi:hypothetical protein
MVHCGPELGSIITYHSTSQLGSSLGLAHLCYSEILAVLGNNMGPYPCSRLTSTSHKGLGKNLGSGLEPNYIGNFITKSSMHREPCTVSIYKNA